jgi:hypothetical protein
MMMIGFKLTLRSVVMGANHSCRETRCQCGKLYNEVILLKRYDVNGTKSGSGNA